MSNLKQYHGAMLLPGMVSIAITHPHHTQVILQQRLMLRHLIPVRG